MAGLNFYSQLQRAVEKAPAKMDGVPAQQWLQWLESNASKLAVKKDEIEWSGIKEYLALQGRQRLFRQDLGAFLQENGVRVEEVQLGRAAPDPKAKYSTYVIPGGANYREVLLMLPAKRSLPSGFTLKPAEVTEFDRMAGVGERWQVVLDEGGRVLAEGTSRDDAIEVALHNLNRANYGLYRSRHWDQPNILAHIRVDDRFDADGKRVLFINEIQSDWGQEGKKKGFDKLPMKGEVRQQEGYDAAAADQFEPEDDGSQRWAVYWEDGTVSGGYASYEAAEQRLRDAAFEKAESVPGAPFVTDTKAWVGLALKRVILMAVEGGYDRVALITGQQAEDLFNLSKQVDRLTWDEFGGSKGNGFLKGFMDGSVVTRIEATAEELPNAIGKEAAQRLLNQKPRGDFGERTIEGEDLKIGGKGMLAFYDQIVPQVARDVLKRLSGDHLEQIRFGDRAMTYDQLIEELQDFDKYPAGSEQRDQLKRQLDSAQDDREEIVGSQPGFTITPAMREMVLAGMPLFSLAEGNQVLDSPSSPDAMRTAIAELVGLDAEQLQEGVGRLVVTTSDQVAGQVKAAREAAFDAWFADSKVVDQEGRPLVVYHGTGGEAFAAFRVSEVGWYGQGIYFTDDASVADDYSWNHDESQMIMPVHLRMERPYYYREPRFTERRASDEANFDLIRSVLPKSNASKLIARMRSEDTGYLHDELVRELRKLGHDGLIVESANFMGCEYIVFDSAQVKSAIGNRGTYDPRDPDITHSLAPARAQAFHDRQSGTTYFLADRIPAGKEASVFLHEVVHRHGRSHLPEGQFDALVGQVKAWEGHAQGSTERSIHDKAAGRVAAAGVSGPVADEELFAYAVEEAVAMGVQPSAMAHEGSAEAWLQAVVQSIQRVADKLIGNSLEQLGGQDLVDLAYALAQVERPELGAVVAQALQEELNPRSPAPAASQPGDAPLVSDVFGEQIEVNGTWYHAERIFGRAASTYGIGDPVPQLAQPKVQRDERPDEVVSAGLFRESGANITDPRKVSRYAEAMRAYGGWGNFPPVVGRVETLSAADLERFEELSAAGCAHELGFSRELKRSDIGMRYVHLENGHHRCQAAHEVGCEIPVFDLHVQERGKDFIQSAKSSDEPVGPGGW